MADGGDGNVLPFRAVEIADPIEDEIYGKPEPTPKPNAQDEFFSHLCNFAQIGLAIARNKNADYAGNGDPFANFRLCEGIGVSLPRGILVRKQDKMARMSNLLERPPQVADETLIQTCIDDAMYSLILAVFIKMHPEKAG